MNHGVEAPSYYERIQERFLADPRPAGWIVLVPDEEADRYGWQAEVLEVPRLNGAEAFVLVQSMPGARQYRGPRWVRRSDCEARRKPLR